MKNELQSTDEVGGFDGEHTGFTAETETKRPLVSARFRTEIRRRIRLEVEALFERRVRETIEIEEEMAAVRAAMNDARQRGLLPVSEPTAFTLRQTAKKLGWSTDEVRRALATGRILGCTVGMQKMVTQSEINRELARREEKVCTPYWPSKGLGHPPMDSSARR